MNDECAVWYWRHGCINYELCESEQAAAAWAYNLDDTEEGSVAGVQFADGRLIKRDDWQALRFYEAEQERARRVRPAVRVNPRASRMVLDPFTRERVVVDHDAPAWLGQI